MELVNHEVVDIKYTKIDKEGDTSHSDRRIIPVNYDKNVRALDVTDDSDADVEKLLQLSKAYSEYFKLQLKTIFSFEDFVEQAFEEDISDLVKWRTFNTSRISEQ